MTPQLAQMVHSPSGSGLAASAPSSPASLTFSSHKSPKEQNLANTNACIVMEYMSRGSLCDLFAKERLLSNCTSRYSEVILCYLH